MEKKSMEQLHRLSVEDFKKSGKTPVTVLLDNVRSMNNVGSVFRTADAFRIEKLYLCGITACPPHKEIEKTALGATESVDWVHLPTTLEAVERLKSEGCRLLAVEQAEGSTPLHRFRWDGASPIALVFGNEVMGVEQAVIDRCDGVIEIPQAGTKHSLNIAVSAGAVLWEVYRQYLEAQASGQTASDQETSNQNLQP